MVMLRPKLWEYVLPIIDDFVASASLSTIALQVLISFCHLLFAFTFPFARRSEKLHRCLAVSANFVTAKNNTAIALTDLGTKVKLEGGINQGVAFYKKAFYYNWHHAGAVYNLGVAYGEMHKFDMPIVFY
ncbi:hypothetical protein P8452_76482 [Trifolium repens]|nr:hypothetical protein P8452_76482 [Trifolium repens]